MENARILINDMALVSVKELHDIICNPRRRHELYQLISDNKIVVYADANEQEDEFQTTGSMERTYRELVV